MKKIDIHTNVILVCSLALLAGIVSCSTGTGASPTATLSPSGVRIDAQVQRVALDKRTITFAQPSQGFVEATFSLTAGITDIDGNSKTLQDITPGMLIEVTGQPTSQGVLMGTVVRILPAPRAAPTLGGDMVLATQVVEKFLSSYSIDPTGNSSVKYLSRNLQSQVQRGTPVPLLLGVQNPIPSFNLDPVEPNPNPDTIVIRVRLNFATRIEKITTLIREDGNWRINQITSV
ncbi:MAG: hypothetical protein ACM3S0_10325 [Acidobacteriota bacterium]